jgi:hypothetical protein
MADTVTLEKPGATISVPAAEAQVEKTADQSPPADASATTEETNVEATAEATPRGDDGRFVKRTEKLQTQINQLTAEKRQTEREVAQLRAEATAITKQLRETPQIDPADFEAQTAHRVRTEIKADRLDQTAGRIEAAEAAARDKDSQIFAL